MKKSETGLAVWEDVQRAITGALVKEGAPLPDLDDVKGFGECFSRFGTAKIVLLGEETHGTSEFYRARAVITRELLQNHGFTIVAVEADWPDAARIDRYVRYNHPRAIPGEAFSRFPTWMWRNVEMMEFLDWLRDYNRHAAPERRVSFHGLDIYSLNASVEAVVQYLDKVDPQAAEAARRRYACLTPWLDEPANYGQAVVLGRQRSCEDEATDQLLGLLSKRMEYMQADAEAFFDAAQNARIVRAAEQYYRVMYRGARESLWNLRDRHMFETLQAILAHRGDDAKAVVWAHNVHVGDAGATAMGWAGEFNIGEFCRSSFGQDAVLIGFGTDHGKVAAASEWEKAIQVTDVPPAREGSYEHAFLKAGVPRLLADWRDPAKNALADALRDPMLERAIGAVFRPESDMRNPSEQFDAGSTKPGPLRRCRLAAPMACPTRILSDCEAR